GVALHAPGRRALPAGEPDGVGSVEMGEHTLESGKAPVLAHVTGHQGVAQAGGQAEEPAVRPAMIGVELPDQIDAHVTSSGGASRDASFWAAGRRAPCQWARVSPWSGSPWPRSHCDDGSRG